MNVEVLNNQSGFSIATVVIMMLILAVMGSVLVSMVGTENVNVMGQVKSQQALYIAEGGIDFILAPPSVYPNYSTLGVTIPLGVGTFRTDTPAYLTAAVAPGNPVTISVDSTSAFAGGNEIILIDNETISCTGVTPVSFTGCAVAQNHTLNASVYPVAQLTANTAIGAMTFPVGYTVGFQIPGKITIGGEVLTCNGTQVGPSAFTCAPATAAHNIIDFVYQKVVRSTGVVPGFFGQPAQRIVAVTLP